jgi:hypothetical protein
LVGGYQLGKRIERRPKKGPLGVVVGGKSLWRALGICGSETSLAKFHHCPSLNPLMLEPSADPGVIPACIEAS